MKITITLMAGLITTLMAAGASAETNRDCVLEGTVKKQQSDSNKVYVAFHSYKAAEDGANCHIRKGEKLDFKQPAGSDITSAKPGAKVEYRYTEDREDGDRWKLRKVSS
ncbi:hypothetical protein EYC98_04375 [Halieaceae bacterium IMCC14734]|uniref:DUF5666 domain-containing protein n=1 Tax=Candidatus Litorirhabdus singularis TaxID=2518993 RepID=A0ABT3TFA9_9GAMM|nr:hypothetical protein [Candidatus Litorirhabdus singularis]MCX2980099.1 hypothetical protein [Candidatus Litorirhabdus singularis]